MALVCPKDVAEGPMAEFFEQRFEEVSAMPFPQEVRQYTESSSWAASGVAGTCPAPGAGLRLDKRSAPEQNIIYTLRPGNRPKVFSKSEPTNAELVRFVAESPLRFLIDPPGRFGRRSEPGEAADQSHGMGHRAMLLGKRAHRRVDHAAR